MERYTDTSHERDNEARLMKTDALLSWSTMAAQEGKLAVDVYQTEETIVVVAPIAGVASHDVSVDMTGDLLTIRGKRERDARIPDDDYFTRECHWGTFSRSIILPEDVRADEITAELRDGILTIIIPKKYPRNRHAITIRHS